MKKSFIYTSLTAALAFAAATNSMAGTLNFHGTITHPGCNVSADSQDLQIEMGYISGAVFNGSIGQLTGAKNFTIHLVDCPVSSTQAVLTFEGQTVTNSDEILALTDTSSASGLGIQLTNSQGQIIKLNQPTEPQVITAGENQLNYVARFITTSNTVKSGEAYANAVFTVNYY
ncbi:fimbrial protein [Enterobacillus tribolii]|uniref:Major type 1 subunit fimbrin (Pilin) n=1 Tax=Enterobacillus tribolii TaxID=1487935 RepID=A0A370R2U5_9GAMM|nr:fimbrial protein [Enterobacillus tribolii]MBW7984734.1 type 1 fimbrial protein [Enterobacillus tribolii]RDK96734.1 major type 1 subunit fimbrin (pilin) [Enterobacillus tribolii]